MCEFTNQYYVANKEIIWFTVNRDHIWYCSQATLHSLANLLAIKYMLGMARVPVSLASIHLVRNTVNIASETGTAPLKLALILL